MESLTDKKCAAAVTKLVDYLSITYARTFPAASAAEAFWQEFEALCNEFSVSLCIRPIGNLEIEAASRRACKRFISACKLHHVQQAGNPSTQSRPRSG